MLTVTTEGKEGGTSRGIYRLAGAVLVQAIEDLRSSSRKNRNNATQWIQDNSQKRFGFVYCCRMLGRDPLQVRLSVMPHAFAMAAIAQRSLHAKSDAAEASPCIYLPVPRIRAA